jgi:hypothetical protein
VILLLQAFLQKTGHSVVIFDYKYSHRTPIR